MTLANQTAPAGLANLGFDLLMIMEVAVLRRRAPKNYSLEGLAPLFYTQLFPHDADGAHCRAPWEHSPMLEFFLDEAEEFFSASPEPGANISSGLWIETMDSGQELPLTATARVLENDQIILIQAMREEYAERIRILRRTKVDLLEKRKLAQTLKSFKKQNIFDSLTKLYNREAFLGLVQSQIAHLPVYAPNLALIMLNIDDFKPLLEDLGPPAGDDILRRLGKIMRQNLRKTDLPVRYGEAEFAVVSPGTTLPQSGLAAERLGGVVARHDFEIDRQLALSLGCTVYRPGEDAKEFITRGRLALQDGQKSGRHVIGHRDPWGKIANSFTEQGFGHV